MEISHLIVSVPWEGQECLLVLHVYRHPSYLRQHVLIVTEVCQQVHDSVADFLIHWLTESYADQRTGIVCKDRRHVVTTKVRFTLHQSIKYGVLYKTFLYSDRLEGLSIKKHSSFHLRSQKLRLL